MTATTSTNMAPHAYSITLTRCNGPPLCDATAHVHSIDERFQRLFSRGDSRGWLVGRSCARMAHSSAWKPGVARCAAIFAGLCASQVFDIKTRAVHPIRSPTRPPPGTPALCRLVRLRRTSFGARRAFGPRWCVAVCSLGRMDLMNYQQQLEYAISTHSGPYQSFEREMYDMMRAALVK